MGLQQFRHIIREEVSSILVENKQKLASEIYDFLDKHAKISANYDPEWSFPEEKYSSPDASEMLVAAQMLERGRVPDVPFSSWNSGGYRPINDPKGERWHNSILDKIKKLR